MPRRRTVLTFFATAIVFVFLGGLGVYLALSIPNDIRAETLLKEARSELKLGKNDAARAKFEEVVKSYPRTDAAAAASYALFRLLDQERKQLEERLEKIQTERAQMQKTMGELGQRVSDASRKAEEAAARPVPAPIPPKPTVTKKPAPKRPTPTRKRRS